VLEDEERSYRAVVARDPRFDGRFLFAVRTTGIYCRPSCPATTPKRRNVEFFPSAAAAQQAGYRACKRCRPDAVPGSPEWAVRGDVAARAVRLVADGVVDREGVGGLARRLGYSTRQLGRILDAEVGAGPLALARAQRAQTARLLAESTSLPLTEVAFAAGFSSVRQFNATVREVYDASPGELRRRAGSGAAGPGGPGELRLRVATRAPFAVGELWRTLARRAVPGVESVGDGCFRRAVRLARGHARLHLAADEGSLTVGIRLDDLRDLPAAVARVRRLVDADADPVAVDALLGADPVLAPAVRRRPGLRALGAVDPEEAALRIVLGQQVSTAAARTLAGRLVAEHGGAVPDGDPGADRCFPTPAELAGVDPDRLPLPRARARTLVGLAAAIEAGAVRLDAGADRDATRAALAALPGIGPWTTELVVQRCLGDPDVLVPDDAAVRAGLAVLGHRSTPLAELAPAWRPWASYAVAHLWAVAGSVPEPGGRR